MTNPNPVAAHPFGSDFELTTSKQLAAFLEVDIATIRRYINAGKLPEPTRLGHNVFWHKASLEAFLAGFGK